MDSMDSKRVEQFFDLVGRYFRDNHYAPQSIKSVLAEIVKESPKAFNQALDRIYTEHLPNRQPPIKVIAEMILHEGRNIRMEEAKKRENDWNREKGADSRGRVEGSTFLTIEAQQSEYAKRACQVIRLMLTDASHGEKCEALEMMAKAYPQSEYPKLHREYVTHGHLKGVRG